MGKTEILVATSLFATAAGDSFIVPAVPVTFGAIPATVYWIAVGVALLVSGLTRRIGQGQMLALGAILAGIGLALCGIAVGNPLLATMARATTGFGIGISMLAAQDAFLSFSGPDRTASATARYLGVYFAGMLMGSFLGGFLVGGFGFGTASESGALLCLAGALVAWRIGGAHHRDQPAETIPLTWRLGPAFPTFLMLAALPTRAVNGGFIYALPLLLTAQDRPPETIAAVAAVYPAVMLLCPVAGRKLDKRSSGASTLGQVLSAGALLLASAVAIASRDQATAIALAAAVLLAVGQIIAMPAQTSVALAAANRLPRPAALGIYRASERIGLAAGPALIGLLSGIHGLQWAVCDLAALSICAAALFTTIGLIGWQRQ
ncbi:MFS transporter [Telmatospirillum siberiense]|uniref:MFS transporter n=1 Tax=Telmatospirillum siberiense TaxID=382514 RepID=A0A2N3PTR5_9PROT|nr:MFS transporter [Telmatospirillum siberiense]PKU23794.1 hypothetical protein CWS72_15010 [Telmatospirillum siberiense]